MGLTNHLLHNWDDPPSTGFLSKSLTPQMRIRVEGATFSRPSSDISKNWVVLFRNPYHSEQHHPHVTEFSYNPKFSEQLNRVCFDDCSFQILKINSTTKKVTLSCGWSIGAVCPTANLIFSWVCLLLVRFFPKERVKTHGNHHPNITFRRLFEDWGSHRNQSGANLPRFMPTGFRDFFVPTPNLSAPSFVASLVCGL